MRIKSSTPSICILAIAFLLITSGCTMQAAERVSLHEPSFPGPTYVQIKSAKPLEAYASYMLVGKEGRRISAQSDGHDRLWWWSDGDAAGGEGTYAFERSRTDPVVKIDPAGEGLINVTIDGKPFTAFHFAKDNPRPYLYPVIGPTGVGVTRDYPMKDTEAETKLDAHDHVHHRSIWTALGDVRTKDFDKVGVNQWSHVKLPALQRVKRIVRTVSGPVFGVIEAEIEWFTPEGDRQFSDTRTYTFFRGDRDTRIIDAQIAFHFLDSDVMFADTKEAGVIALRIAASMTEKAGKGHMVNSEGKRGMKECWGQPADWCDYDGPVDGKTVGIAVMDAKTNLRHPTRWHIRDYGLYTANPFGLRDFSGDKTKNGSMTWKKGQHETFNYRILIHNGDTKAAHIAEQYQLYTEPAKMVLK